MEQKMVLTIACVSVIFVGMVYADSSALQETLAVSQREADENINSLQNVINESYRRAKRSLEGALAVSKREANANINTLQKVILENYRRAKRSAVDVDLGGSVLDAVVGLLSVVTNLLALLLKLPL